MISTKALFWFVVAFWVAALLVLAYVAVTSPL